MRITLQLQRPFFEILLEGELLRRAHPSILKPAEIPQECLSSEELEEQLRALEVRGAKRYVLRRLAKQPLASTELAQLLAKRCVSSTTIEKVLTECQNAGYLDDEIWLQGYVKGCLSRKLGPRAIAEKLRVKGIPVPRIKAILEVEATLPKQSEGIRRLLTTRYRSRDLTQYKERQKVIAALLRKGYALDLIQACLN
jgi:regulatory protein